MERHSITHEVIASDREDAIAKVANGEGTIMDNSLELRDTMDTDTWEVESI